jgi:hypothetical protein
VVLASLTAERDKLAKKLEEEESSRKHVEAAYQLIKAQQSGGDCFATPAAIAAAALPQVTLAPVSSDPKLPNILATICLSVFTWVRRI